MKKLCFSLALFISFFLVHPVHAADVGELMRIAAEPIGKCLYVYGGGWNEEDTAAGKEALNYGISPGWIEFYNKNNSAYDYTKTKYQIHNGLDCTGYVGWCMYQLYGNTYSNSGYVYASKDMAEGYKNLFGATIAPASGVKDFKCGDIMSKAGHVYIVLGSCSDGSVVFMHASPPNISLCGTYTPGGKKNSQAIYLAQKYMKEYFYECYKKYPNCSRGTSYLTTYDKISIPTGILADADGYRNMDAEQILRDLFENTKLYVNGKRIGVNEKIFIIDGSTYVPLRCGAEALGAEVSWDGEDKKAIISQKDTKINLRVNSSVADVNGEEQKLPGEVFIYSDRTYIPVRFIAENLGAEVIWDSKWKRVLVSGN